MFRIARTEVEFQTDRARILRSDADEEPTDALSEEPEPAPEPQEAMPAIDIDEQIRLVREKADEIMRDAFSQAELLREKAQQEGYAKGWMEASARADMDRERERAAAQAEQAAMREAAEQKRREDEAALEKLLFALEAARSVIFQELEDSVGELALAVASKILQTKLQRTRAIDQIVAKAIAGIREAARITVRLCPEDAERFLQAEHEYTVDGQAVAPIVIRDEGLVRGDCVVETNRERVDAGVRAQLENLREAFARQGGDA